MSQPFGTPNTQQGFSLGTAAQPTATAATGSIFGAGRVGAGDATKPPNLGLPQMTLQSQVKPANQGFSTTFATPNIGAQSTAPPAFGTTRPPAFGTASPPAFGTTPSWATGLGTPASGTSGFSISQPNTVAPASTAGLTSPAFGTLVGTSTVITSQLSGLGSLAPTSTTRGFSFGANSATATTAPTLSFNIAGTPAAPAAQVTPAIQFGAQETNVSTAAATSTGGGLSITTFGTPQVAPTSATGFNISAAPLQTTPSIGTNVAGTTPASSAAAGFNLPTSQTQPAQTTLPSFNLGGTATTTPASGPPGFGLGTPASVTSFAIANTAPTTAAPTFNLGGTTTATSTPGFMLGKSIAAPVSTVAQTSAPQTSLGTATNVTSSTVAASQPGGLNFCQLEESINKWTLELEEQEKAFVNQATQVNAWDRLLIANGEKIVTLNQEVERVKLEQQQLEHELDYVVGQQRELQDCLVPLEKELGSVSASDPEREYTYRLAENLDTQLKQMSEDLKEIIEHLNEANRSQDSSDPIVQIGKILNAHMNSLQWLDQRTAALQTKIQQIDQLHQNFRQEHERSFNLAYN